MSCLKYADFESKTWSRILDQNSLTQLLLIYTTFLKLSIIIVFKILLILSSTFSTGFFRRIF